MMQQMYLLKNIDKKLADFANLFNFAALIYGDIAGKLDLYNITSTFYPDTGPGGRIQV